VLNNSSKDINNLKAEIARQNEEINTYLQTITKQTEQLEHYKKESDRLKEIIIMLRKSKYAPSSEKIDFSQAGFFDEAENDSSKGEESRQEVKTYTRGKPKRKPLPDFLPREERVIELSEEERICKNDGHRLKEIGSEVSEKLDIIPAQIKVIRIIRKKYACPICEDGVITAKLDPQAIPKSIATAGLLAFIAISKYCDALPLYRIEGILQRFGACISRGSLANWMIRISELFRPLLNLLNEELLSSNYVSCDETPVQVLKEPGKKATSKSYMWVRCRSGPGVKPIILFDYDQSRSGKVPVQLLEGFEGYLQVDGYTGYNEISQKPRVMRVGCLAHVRRKFVDALKASKKSKSKSEQAVGWIRKLYKIEKEISELSTEQRYAIRQEKSVPILQELKNWINGMMHKVLPKSELGKALLYTKNEWENIIRYVEDGCLNIDNNRVENAIRPFAVGRKNWLFCDSVAGANASASIYSLIETAKANGHEPYSYLELVWN